MTTVRQQIEKISNMYQEPKGEPQLSKEDFLANMALADRNSRCRDTLLGTSCFDDNKAEYGRDPDRFIASELGNGRSFRRKLFDKQAELLLQVAKRFAGSEEEYTSASQYGRRVDMVNNFFEDSGGPVRLVAQSRAAATTRQCDAAAVHTTHRSYQGCVDSLGRLDDFYLGCVEFATGEFLASKPSTAIIASLRTQGCISDDIGGEADCDGVVFGEHPGGEADCDGVVFGEHLDDDMRCFGKTLFD